MLAYSANRPAAGERESSPNALLLVISVPIALLALAMSAKMDFPKRIARTPPLINVPVPVPPLADDHVKAPQPHPKKLSIERPIARLVIPTPQPEVRGDNSSASVDPGATSGEQTVAPPISQSSATALIHREARLLTPSSELRPPYPPVKLASEEEATLHLRLTIDETGRVRAVEPVGYADREFLDTARRYILSHWRYEPASDGGLAISTTITVESGFLSAIAAGLFDGAAGRAHHVPDLEILDDDRSVAAGEGSTLVMQQRKRG
jgi:protein TonB